MGGPYDCSEGGLPELYSREDPQMKDYYRRVMDMVVENCCTEAEKFEYYHSERRKLYGKTCERMCLDARKKPLRVIT